MRSHLLIRKANESGLGALIAAAAATALNVRTPFYVMFTLLVGKYSYGVGGMGPTCAPLAP